MLIVHRRREQLHLGNVALLNRMLQLADLTRCHVPITVLTRPIPIPDELVAVRSCSSAFSSRSSATSCTTSNARHAANAPLLVEAGTHSECKKRLDGPTRRKVSAAPKKKANMKHLSQGQMCAAMDELRKHANSYNQKLDNMQLLNLIGYIGSDKIFRGAYKSRGTRNRVGGSTNPLI